MSASKASPILCAVPRTSRINLLGLISLVSLLSSLGMQEAASTNRRSGTLIFLSCSTVRARTSTDANFPLIFLVDFPLQRARLWKLLAVAN